MAYGARLESVLGASPRGFESPILRHWTPGPLQVPGFLLFGTPLVFRAAGPAAVCAGGRRHRGRSLRRPSPAVPARRVVRRVVSRPGLATMRSNGAAASFRWGRPVVMCRASSRLRAWGENVYAGGRSSA